MSMSSVCVVSNALMLKLYKNKKNTEKPIINERTKAMKKTIFIEGMMCPHCTGRVDKLLNSMEGITAEVSLEDKCAYITLTKEYADSDLITAIENEGYKVTEIR